MLFWPISSFICVVYFIFSRHIALTFLSQRFDIFRGLLSFLTSPFLSNLHQDFDSVISETRTDNPTAIMPYRLANEKFVFVTWIGRIIEIITAILRKEFKTYWYNLILNLAFIWKKIEERRKKNFYTVKANFRLDLIQYFFIPNSKMPWLIASRQVNLIL